MPIAIITGSGTHSLPGFEHGETDAFDTPFGASKVLKDVTSLKYIVG